jgi:isoleucyl-tRNA synthetase
MTLDDKGRKMSKSLGNVVDPQTIIRESGVDVLRLWVASTDTSEDQRFGKLAMQTTVDAYRKLRNTLRYLLGALKGYTAEEALPVADMPELERYILSRLAALDAEVRGHVHVHAYAKMMAAITSFVNSDLSAFFFDVRKDSLYCDGALSPKRRAYRTVLATLFDALNAWLAPVLVFTTEEAHEHRWGEGAGSVHFGTYADIPAGWRDEALEAKFDRLRELRALVTLAIEPMRRDKQVGSSNEVAVRLAASGADAALVRSVDFAELCIVSSVEVIPSEGDAFVQAASSSHARCARCWRHLPDVSAETALCGRCDDVVLELDA